MAESLTIGDRLIGSGHPCFVIAEAGVNHNGNVPLAHQLIDVAAEAAVDAIKFQTFDPEKLAAPGARKAQYQLENTSKAGTQLDMLRELVLPKSAYPELIRHAADRGLLFLSTPFDEGSADFIEELQLSAFKISSGDLTNHPFLVHLAKKGRPLLLSTGMAALEEVESAVKAVKAAEDVPIALLHCVTSYPADPTDCNLRAMSVLRSSFKLPTGWSDHTMGFEIALAAVALGANLVEKHVTLDRNLSGPDHRASLEPGELRAMVEAIRRVESALGNGVKEPRPCEFAVMSVARKSLHWKKDLQAGVIAEPKDFIALRPGVGILPSELKSYVGRKLTRETRVGQIVAEQDFESRA
jgi:N,N'-diacetyllegionaminate synthase